jgi:hypothetical protein
MEWAKTEALMDRMMFLRGRSNFWIEVEILLANVFVFWGDEAVTI